jgi:hypothetical protein
VTSVQHDAAPELHEEESFSGLSPAVATEESIGTELTEATNVNLVKASCEYTPDNKIIAGYYPSHSILDMPTSLWKVD